MHISVWSIKSCAYRSEGGTAMLLALFLIALLLPVAWYFSLTAHEQAGFARIASIKDRSTSNTNQRLADLYYSTSTPMAAPDVRSIVDLGSVSLISLSAVERQHELISNSILLFLASKNHRLFFPNWNELLSNAEPGCTGYRHSPQSAAIGRPNLCTSLSEKGGSTLVVSGNLISGDIRAPQTLVVLGDLKVTTISFEGPAEKTVYAVGDIDINALAALNGSGPVFIGSARGALAIETLRGVSLCSQISKPDPLTPPAQLSLQASSKITVGRSTFQQTAGCYPKLNRKTWLTRQAIGIGSD